MSYFVSCVMPTYNRRPFIKAALESYLSQTYKQRELIVVDDGEDSIEDLIPEQSDIQYIRIATKTKTGKKRNLTCEAARGEVIVHFDDDDWSSPDRIKDQIGRLTATNKPITGYGSIYFWDRVELKARRYNSSIRGYVVGTSLCYLKEFWKIHPFKDQQVASDNAFVYPVLHEIASAEGFDHLVARIHDCHHTSSKGGIADIVDPKMLPSAFWRNDKLICPSS